MIAHSGRPRIARRIQRDVTVADLEPATRHQVRFAGAAVLLSVLALALLAGCPKPVSTTLYPVPMPALDQPAPFTYDRAPDTCPGPEPVLTGEPFPFEVDGVASCGGILLGDEQFARLIHVERVTEPWLRVYAGECAAGRERDRVWAQAAYDHQAASAMALQRENRALRLTGPALFVGGLLVGAGVTAAVITVDVSIVSGP